MGELLNLHFSLSIMLSLEFLTTLTNHNSNIGEKSISGDH